MDDPGKETGPLSLHFITPQMPEEFIFFFSHRLFVASRTFVIVSRQVKETVYHEKKKSVFEGNSRFTGVPGRRVDGNDNVPQGKRVTEVAHIFRYRKGKDVGRTVPLEIEAIEGSNLLVTHEGERELTLFQGQGVKNVSEVPTEGR